MPVCHSQAELLPISFPPQWEVVEMEKKGQKASKQTKYGHRLWETPGPATVEEKKKNLYFNITKHGNIAKTHCILSLINPP